MQVRHSFGPGGSQSWRRTLVGVAVAAAILYGASPAAAQIDPLLVVKRSIATFTSVDYRAHVLLAVDTSERMQWGYHKPTDNPSSSTYLYSYFDPLDYARSCSDVFDLQMTTPCVEGERYRRRYVALDADHVSALHIEGTAAQSASAYSRFYAWSRLGAARAALAKVVQDNITSARFGLLKTRQQLTSASSTPSVATTDSSSSWVNQQVMTDSMPTPLWTIGRPAGSVNNSSLTTVVAPLVKADVSTANTDVTTILGRDPSAAEGLVGAGNDTSAFVDSPLENLLEDAKSEAQRLIAADTRCRNTVVVLITGGGEGTAGSTPTAEATAMTFRSISGRRVPIHVIGLAVPDAQQQQLIDIALNSGGMYTFVTKEEIDAAATSGVAPPSLVRAVNIAVQHGFANPSDVNATPTGLGTPKSEFQVTSPIVGTVDLYQASFFDGTMVPDSESRITSATGTTLPQRSNLMVTSGFSLPGFEAMLHAFRVYKPVADSTKPSGYRFVADGRKLWDASAPSASSRNIFTSLQDGTLVAFTSTNWSQLQAPMRLTGYSQQQVQDAIDAIRALPLGPIVSSTPAILDPPSVDPPPDDEYPAFIDANAERRTLVFVGANDGMLHAFDGRTGLEVWAFIPYNLLPKMAAYLNGQPIDSFLYSMDGSPKLADVKVSVSGTPTWKTYLIIGQGSGGTFYQAFDVTMPGLGSCVAKDSNSTSTLLGCFSSASRITLKWTFPNTASFDTASGTWGDLSSSATDTEKSVGQTWSDPAVGQIENEQGTYAVVTGSGFFPYSAQQSAARGGAVAGRSFYLLDVNDGSVTDVKDVGSDSKAEDVDNCAATSPKGCTEIKNALQGDPVATGPPDSRFITKAYIGDLDGNLWRFPIAMVSGVPKFTANPTKLYASGADQPLFASMAAVTVGTQQYLFFGGGSDLLPTPGVNGSYKLFGLLEGQSTPSFTVSLTTTDGSGDDEKVSAFPAVAGDIVFFTTTNLKPAAPCAAPDANLYAFTFIGGAAYDSSGDNKVGKNESPKVKTLVGEGRATAPFIVDQHLWFGAGSKVSVFGDPQDFNNGVGQMGVRILSWRQVR